jgi:hypothetical protein
MSNIIFSKKFHAKLTAIVRNFWWTGINADPDHKPLCLAAWKNICAPTKDGGLVIRNLNAVNHALILTSIWRIAENSHSQIIKFSNPNISPILPFGELNQISQNQHTGPQS